MTDDEKAVEAEKEPRKKHHDEEKKPPAPNAKVYRDPEASFRD